MRQKKGFTLIELLVVISIIALLLALLMPSLGKARNLAMIASCSGQLKQWGLVCSQYANDNNNMFWQGWFGEPLPANSNADKKLWMCVMWKYFQNPDFMFCPGAKLSFDAGNATRGTSERAWGGMVGLSWCSMPRPGVRDNRGQIARWNPKGSYGENSWVANKTGSGVSSSTCNYYWRTMHIPNGVTVPLLGDSSWLDAWVMQNAEPPPYKDAPGVSGDNMWRLCIDRHTGKTNWVFMDTSVRPVPLKELFTLNWYRGYSPESSMYTWAFYQGNGDPTALWPDWMKDYAEYK